ncbi:MAG TPA: hypothetical protein VEK08_07125 [Planctomycetota bacterium]|nr:hypothetical protein [Planctomycetota bacterium]
MSDLVFKLSAEEGEAVSAFLKILDVQKKVEEQAKKTKSVWDEMPRSIKKIKEDAGKDLQGMADSFANVGNGLKLGIGIVKSAFAALTEEMHKNAREAKEFTDNFVSAMAKAGSLQNVRENRAFLLNADLPGINLKARTDIFKTISEQMPTASDEEKRAAMLQIGKAKQTGLSDADLVELADTYGNLAPVLLKNGKSINQSANISKLVQERLGKRGQKLDKSGRQSIESLITDGFGVDEAVSMAVTAIESGGSAEAVVGMVDKLRNLKEVTKGKAKDPAVQAELSSIDKQQSEIDQAQESLRRRQADLNARGRSRPMKRRAAQELEAEEEQLRRKEFDLHQRKEELEKKLEPVSILDTIQNDLLKLSVPDRMRRIRGNPALAQYVFGDGLAASMGRQPEAMTEELRTAQNDLISRRSSEALNDPELQSSLNEAKDLAEGDLAQMRMERQQSLRYREARAALERASKEAGDAPLDTKLRLGAFEARQAAGYSVKDSLTGFDQNRPGANPVGLKVYDELEERWKKKPPLEVKIVNDGSKHIPAPGGVETDKVRGY